MARKPTPGGTKQAVVKSIKRVTGGEPKAVGAAPVLGRPTSYDPSFCDRVIEMAKDGDGPAAYSAEFGIDRGTLYKWADTYPDFRTALNRAKQIEQVWWERAGRAGMHAKTFNAVVWKTSMQARFREDYTERKATEISGPNGDPVQIQSQVVDARVLTEEQRAVLRDALLTAKNEGTEK